MKLIKTLVVLACLFFLAQNVAVAAKPVLAPLTEEIDGIFSDWDSNDVPGASVGVFKDGSLIFKKGYGMANLEYGIPNSPTSVFRIASTSKQFTAATIILLALDEKLSLDDSLHEFFPEFPEYAKDITIRHLLNHTSGIRDYLMLTYLAGYTDYSHYSDDDVMKLLLNQKGLNFLPGEEFVYSNSGYWLLGKIVENITDMSLREYAEQHIFKPLGMTNTHFHDDHTEIVRNRASGYTPGHEGVYRISMTTLDMVGDGGVYTTIEDMKKWDDSFYHSSVMPDKLWSQLTTLGHLNSGKALTYAAGLTIGDYKGRKVISHGGAFVGYRAQFVRFPEEKFSVIVLANRADANSSAKAYQVADLFLGKSNKVSPVPHTSVDESVTDGIILPVKILQQWVGSYWFEDDALNRRIEMNGSKLVYVRGDESKSELIAVTENEFIFADNPEYRLRFSKVEDNLNEMSLISSNWPTTLARQYKSISLSDEKLAVYEGDYYSKELDVIYSIKLKDNTLLLSVNGMPETRMTVLTLLKLKNDDFGTFIFDGNHKQGGQSFRINIGRVSNILFTKVNPH